MKDWVDPIRRLAEQADRVHVLMNNCYGDYGPQRAAIGRASGGVKACYLLVPPTSGSVWKHAIATTKPGWHSPDKRETRR